MSKLVKIVYDVAGIHGRYRCVHNEIFHLSARKLVRFLNPDLRDLYTSQASVLDGLLQQLNQTQSELEDLAASDLSIRRGIEIQSELADYVVALVESIKILKSISELMKQRATKEKIYSAESLQSLKVAYDDAMQHHKRLGAHLNALIATL